MLPQPRPLTNSTRHTIIALFVAAIAPSCVHARTPDTAPAAVQEPITAQDLEGLFDPLFAEEMAKHHLPGAVVTVVHKGRIVFAKGYGMADLEKKTHVTPHTLFRIGSITKVFTATAVMQLADRGQLSLDDDVNRYLSSVRVPDTFPEPVTFAHLLTHTSGLDEISPGRRTSRQSELVPLSIFLKDRLVRNRPPGEIISYSTYNPALAALAVEHITRRPFASYLDGNVFQRIGMTRTSIAAIKAAYRDELATGYEYTPEGHQRLPFQWFHTYPASDVNSTATDMAKFMMTHLALGAADGGRRLFSERTARTMQQTQFRNHPRVPGWAYGFYEGISNGVRFIEHGGSMDDGYSALMTLVPDAGLGIFVAANTEFGGLGLGGVAKQALFDRYFPPPPVSLPAVPHTALEPLQQFAGKYRGTIFCHSCAPGSGAYVPEPFDVTVTNDGMLSFLGGRWRQIEPMLFVLTDGARAGRVFFGFRRNSKGSIGYMFTEAYNVYERVPD